LPPFALCRLGILALALIQFAVGASAQQARPIVGRDLASAVSELVSNSSSFERWNRVIVRFGRERQDATATCAPNLACPRDQWASLVAELKTLPLRERVLRVNAVLNRLPYIPAERNWGDVAYWETPYEFLARGGQCQDYAIAKYLALEESGVPTTALRFVVVRDTLRGLDHAIDIVTVDGAALVLDNQVQEVTPAVGNQRYQPYYALNDQGWWIAKPTRAALSPAGYFPANNFQLARH
jgi:predicted transglutaminase-like cysteine proteinase